VLLLCACGSNAAPADGPVSVAVPPAPAEAVAACAALAQHLPSTLGERLARRPVSGDQVRTAAWGSGAAVTLACGVVQAGQPGVDGEPTFLGAPDGRQLEFLVDDAGAANTWLTLGRTVAVQVTVPDAYDSQSVQRLVVPLLDALPQAADLGDGADGG
jgi:hypothetical protein